MAANKIKVYWIFLLLLLYTGGLVMAVSPTQARYDGTAVSTTVLEPAQPAGIFSDCMVGKDDPAITVLLGELVKTEKVSFWLKSVGTDATGKLSWGFIKSDEVDYADYLDISLSLDYGNTNLDPSKENLLALPDGMNVDLLLTITPTPNALTTPHGMMKINVIVTWGEEMWGTFQVVLPAVTEVEKAEEAAEGESEKEEAQSLEESLIEGDISTKETTDEEEGTTQKEANEDPEKSQSQTDSSEGDQTDLQNEDDPDNDQTPSQTSDQNLNAGTQGEDSTGNGESGNPTDGTGENGNAGSANTSEENNSELLVENPVETEDPLQLRTLPVFDPAGLVPVYLRVANDITSVRLGIEPSTGEETKIKPFPDGTRLSLDGGNSYYMISCGYIPDLMVQDLAVVSDDTGELQPYIEATVLLDFSHTELNQTQKLFLSMETYSGETYQERALAETTPNGDQHITQVIYSPVVSEENTEEETQPEETEQNQAEETEQEQTQPEETEGEPIRLDKLILSRDYYLEQTFPQEWAEAELEYSVTLLTMTEEGALAYKEVTLSEESLAETYTKDEKEHKLELKIGEKLPEAGTYRLNLNWSYKGICFKQTQTTFFINYSVYLNKDLSSQEVQTND